MNKENILTISISVLAILVSTTSMYINIRNMELFKKGQQATEQATNLTGQQKVEMFNAGYRSGAYNILSWLYECKGVTDANLIIAKKTYAELIIRYDGTEIDNQYPCTE